MKIIAALIFLFNQMESFITMKLYHTMPNVTNVILNMWTFDIFKPRAFKRSRGPLHWLGLNNIWWKFLFSYGNIWKIELQHKTSFC